MLVRRSLNFVYGIFVYSEQHSRVLRMQFYWRKNSAELNGVQLVF